MQDVALEKTDELYDLTITDGDFTSLDSFDTAIELSLQVDVRADESEQSQPGFRRGWIGNEQNDDPDYQIGSKLWLLSQARSSQDTLNIAIDYVEQSLQWMIDDQQVKKIDVAGSIVDDNIIINVTFTRFDDSILNKQFELWNNTTLA